MLLNARLSLLVLISCFTVFAGCSSVDSGPEWVSKEGKSQEQFFADQADCRQDINRKRGPGFTGLGGMGSGWDMNDMKEFDTCLRAKGWTKNSPEWGPLLRNLIPSNPDEAK